MGSATATDVSGIRPRFRWARTLSTIVDHTRSSDVVLRRDLAWGDRVIVRTRNSVYCLHALGDDTFTVSGGWFDRNPGTGPVTVNGCTYGGSVIRADVVAGRGLFLEFGNTITTTRIQEVRVVGRPRDCGLA